MDHIVSLDYLVRITVANIEADSGALAFAKATEITDHKSLLDRHFRNYDIDLREGSVLSIESSDQAEHAVVTVLRSDGSQVSCSYEANHSGEISPAYVNNRIHVVEAARLSIIKLNELLSNIKEIDSKHAVLEVMQTLAATGIADVPLTIEQQIQYPSKEFDGVHVQPNNTPEDTPEPSVDHELEVQTNNLEREPEPDPAKEEPPSLLEKITALVKEKTPNPKEDDVFSLLAPVFLSHVDRETDSEPEKVWEISFGEIKVTHNGETIALIGHWKDYADQKIPYFESKQDFLMAQIALLRDNGLEFQSTEKPEIGETIEASFYI